MKRNNRTKIALILVAVLAVAAVGMIAYGFYSDVKAGKGIDAGHAARAALVFASIVISVVKIVNGSGGQRRSPEMYRKEYGFIIGNSFTDDKKREKAFFSALDMYNDDLKGTIDNVDGMLDAGKGYKTFTKLPSGMDGNVKFIYKTDIISKFFII
jgi:hypothetical protein